MRLNNATITNFILNGNPVKSVGALTSSLLKATNLVADVYVNTKLLFSCKPIIREDNCWLMVYVDRHFALAAAQSVESILIRVHQCGSETVIFESLTVSHDIIPAGDVDADLNFALISTAPNCTMKCNVPDSKFTPLHTENLATINLADQPSANQDVEVEDSDDDELGGE
jgi:hypothetical protein